MRGARCPKARIEPDSPDEAAILHEFRQNVAAWPPVHEIRRFVDAVACSRGANSKYRDRVVRYPVVPRNSALLVPPRFRLMPEGAGQSCSHLDNSLPELPKSGAGEGIRTPDPNLGKVVLYP